MKTVNIKVGSETIAINVPTFTNTSKISIDDEIVVLKEGPDDDDEPASKRPRTGIGSKGTGKAGKRKNQNK